MTFYNHIESARYEMFRLVNGWTREGAETKARISESLDQARREYMEMEAENNRLREELESVGTAAYLYGRSDLKAENTKLRELLLDVADVLGKNEKLLELAKRLRSAASDVTDNAREVLDENAKLRKLLIDVWNDAIEFDGFWLYVHDDGEIYNEDELPHYQERMRELGIEV